MSKQTETETETYHFAPGREYHQDYVHSGTFAACQADTCRAWRAEHQPRTYHSDRLGTVTIPED